MKTKKIFSSSLILFSMLGLITLLSCESYMRNPLTDKETDENIKLLIVDFNFITTKLACHLQDITTNENIVGEEVEISFLGEDAANLITYTGTKPEKFLTTEGYIEIGWDPNFPVSPEAPIELTVLAKSENYISAPMAISYSNIGLKDIVIKMINTGQKSGSTGGFDEPFDIKYNDVLESDQLSFIADVSAAPTGTDYDYLNLYNTLSAGSLVSENLSDPVVYTDYGVYFHNSGLTDQLVPPADPSKDASLGTNYSVYSSVLRTGIEKCSNGSTVTITSSDGSMGRGSLNYLITYSDGTTDDGIISGTFPIQVPIDNIYYPSSDPSVTVKVFDDGQYDLSAQVSLSSPCGASADFTATRKPGLETYKFIVRYSCPDALASAALSISCEFRKVGSLGSWTRFQFVEGITYLQLVPDADYDFKVIIDSESYEYQLPTNPDNLEEFLLDNQSEDFYTIKTLTITELTDMVVIETDVELTGEICDIIQ